MQRTFIQTLEFEKNWETLGFSDDNLRKLEQEILKHPKTGKVIRGTGKLRKMRFAFEHRGKSGSVRVCYVDFEAGRKSLKRRKIMSSVYESIFTGLNEAIEDAQSDQKKLKRRVVAIEPIKDYSANEVRAIRKATGLSQRLFAGYMGVSVKTVEAWEAGTNQPSGAASRILSMMEMDESLISRFPFVKM